MSDTAILAGKQDAALSIVESKSLSSLEQVIERGQKTFMEVGKALLVIQEQKLYRQDCKTFAEYCNVRWGFAKSRAYQMIDAAKVVGNVHQGGQIEPPTTERQARPLASLPAAQQANAWADVVNECAERGEPITAAAVVEVVEKYKAQAEPNSETDDDFDDVVPDRGPCSPAFNNAPLYNGLLGALAHYGLPSIEAAEKNAMRDLALRPGPHTVAEQAALLAYCETDVDALAKLLPVMLPKIDLPRALLRGRYMAAVASMEGNGIPIDLDALNALRNGWDTHPGRHPGTD